MQTKGVIVPYTMEPAFDNAIEDGGWYIIDTDGMTILAIVKDRHSAEALLSHLNR
jgi:hypothetical protein